MEVAEDVGDGGSSRDHRGGGSGLEAAGKVVLSPRADNLAQELVGRAVEVARGEEGVRIKQAGVGVGGEGGEHGEGGLKALAVKEGSRGHGAGAAREVGLGGVLNKEGADEGVGEAGVDGIQEVVREGVGVDEQGKGIVGVDSDLELGEVIGVEGEGGPHSGVEEQLDMGDGCGRDGQGLSGLKGREGRAQRLNGAHLKGGRGWR